MNNVIKLNTPATPTTPSAPSIAASAMLVELKIRQWTSSVLDKSASKQVVADHNAAAKVARVYKDLLGDCAELRDMQLFASRARKRHYEMTMPWSDTGLRLLPTAQYFKYTEVVNQLQIEFYALANKLFSAYQWKIASAQADLGSLFNPHEYPTEAELRSKFSLVVSYIPVPQTGDWRINIGKQGNEQVQAHYDQFYRQALSDAMGSVWERAHEALGRMSERLDYAEKGTKKVFRESLVPNVLEIIDLMDVCNITNDPVMSDAAAALRKALQGIDTDDLRQDAGLRRVVKRSVDEVLSSIPSLDM